MNKEKVGNQIAVLRKENGLTQGDLGDRLGVTFQSVSKWERGEALPDTAILPDLAKVLGTTIDSILSGGEKALAYNGKITVSDMAAGVKCLAQTGELLGKQNPIYRHAIHGINEGMNIDIEEAFSNDYIFECFVAEAIIQNLMGGAYIDTTDVKNSFKHEHFRNIVLEYCGRYGIK